VRISGVVSRGTNLNNRTARGKPRPTPVIPAKAGIQRIYQKTPAQPDNKALSAARIIVFTGFQPPFKPGAGFALE
jgi:hypothetical protein